MNLNLAYTTDWGELVLLTIKDSRLIRCVRQDAHGATIGNYTDFMSMPQTFRQHILTKLKHDYQLETYIH